MFNIEALFFPVQKKCSCLRARDVLPYRTASPFRTQTLLRPAETDSKKETAVCYNMAGKTGLPPPPIRLGFSELRVSLGLI